MKYISTLILLIVFIGLTSCKTPPTQPTPAALPADIPQNLTSGHTSAASANQRSLRQQRKIHPCMQAGSSTSHPIMEA